jgi:hypothetical protein
MEQQSTNRDGEIYGGLMLNLRDNTPFDTIGFPFTGIEMAHGNHIMEHSKLTVNNFDYWHGGRDTEHRTAFVAERGISIDARGVGHDCKETLRNTVHRVLTMNSGVKREDRGDMMEMVTEVVLSNIQVPSAISMAVQSSQPKFILFSRDIPLHVNVFCDEACMLMIWTNESTLEERMREEYGERFSVFRMPPIINSVAVIHSYYLSRKIRHWRYRFKDRLKLLNAIEGQLRRKTKATEVP